MVTGSHLESKDLLFQTLNTTHKRFRLPNGQMALMLDTVGFITNLPHGLVESFKTTLEEIHHAELLVHVRDISHPQTDYQRDTVLRVLREIGVPEEVLATRYCEVWNKIDLLPDQHTFLGALQQDMAATKQSYPVVMLSCKDGTNREGLMAQLQESTARLMGIRPVEIVYSYHLHDRVVKWMQEHANLSNPTDCLEYLDDGRIKMMAPIDEVTHMKYLKQFEPETFDRQQNQGKRLSGRGMKPPPGWDNNE
jgi:50S ribosomal subunit-associated GTPase HflX